MKDKLYKICKDFIEKHDISCEDCIGQQDSIILDAYDLIQDICNCVGYTENMDE